MILSLLARLGADLVFESAVELRRSFDAEMSRYLEQRGFRTPPPTASAR
jgi:hypothetical protein